MKIYTKTGDNGSTSLIGGSRVAKDDLSIETFGTLDELNAHLGLLRPMLLHQYDKAFVTHIQSLLFAIWLQTPHSPISVSVTSFLPLKYKQSRKRLIKLRSNCLHKLLLFCLVDAVVQRKPMYAERFVDELSDV